MAHLSDIPGKALTLLNGLFNIFAKQEEPSIIDDTGVGGITYVGFAVNGTPTSAPRWKVKKITEVGTITTIEYADGDSKFDNIWDDRATLTYA
jgi:hypothetical protein